MGDFRVRQIRGKEDRHAMYAHALRDIQAFELLLERNAFATKDIHIGAEQELCIVDQHYQPTKSGGGLLASINDPHYTNELGLFNLEINLDPQKLAGQAFSIVENELIDLMSKGQKHAQEINNQLILAGILPTLKSRHLTFDYMTPIERYQTLSRTLYDIRGGDFEIYLQGVDDLMASLGSVLFEACNTSFQLHLQVDPSEFAPLYNWSQMISGPVLACSVNSPLLLGRELWAETRIGLFKQSLDTRSSKNHLRKKLPRVYFGDQWLTESPVQLWKNELMRFPLLVTSDDFQNPLEAINQGQIPDLRAIRLHTGTTYTWNRLCYGTSDPPHLRIECRYLPAGPSIRDEIANFAFWIGLMKAMPRAWESTYPSLSFREVKDNFIRSARNGLHAAQHWYGKSIPAQKLILDTLLPMAHHGLEACGISDSDRKAYLGVIERRVSQMQTGADWTVKSHRNLISSEKSTSINQKLVARSIQYQEENIPVSDWEPIKKTTLIPLLHTWEDKTVGHIMSTDIFTVHIDASIEFAQRMMEWKDIHHLPVEDGSGNLVGQVDAVTLRANGHAQPKKYVSDIMTAQVSRIDESASLEDLKQLLTDQGEDIGICVTSGDKIVGIVTVNDLTPYLSVEPE
ncbi:MAG: CBS domain-containing protein [Saprospiraceae bacterium]|nr:CBS domain-containing protein [Saprospiraceae bacterium]